MKTDNIIVYTTTDHIAWGPWPTKNYTRILKGKSRDFLKGLSEEILVTLMHQKQEEVDNYTKRSCLALRFLSSNL